VIPLLIVLFTFAWGARIYFSLYRPPADAVQYYVTGKQWMWKTQHPTGQREINELHVPVGQPTKLLMTSEDVIHSFYIPAFRTKADVLPGRYTSIWFNATKPGRYHLFCAEYCGAEHSRMIGSIVVQSPEDYQKWLASVPVPRRRPRRASSSSPSSPARAATRRAARPRARRSRASTAPRCASPTAATSPPTNSTCASRSCRRAPR